MPHQRLPDRRLALLSNDVLTVSGLQGLVLEWREARLVAAIGAPDGLSAMLHRYQPHCVVVDIDALWTNPLQASAWLARVRRHYVRLQLTVVSHRTFLPLLPPGVAFACKRDGESLRHALRASEAPLSGEWLACPSGVETLTRREWQVLNGLLEGLSLSEIAKASVRSIKTVSAQKRTALAKLGVCSLQGLWGEMMQGAGGENRVGADTNETRS